MRPLAARLTVAVLCFCWGSTWVVVKLGDAEHLPPLSAAGVRFAIAAVLMAIFAGPIRRREGGEVPPAWLWILLGCTNFAISYGIVYWAITVLPSGLCSLLWAVFPLQMALASHFLLGEPLRARHGVGFLFGFCGIGLLFLTDLRKAGSDAIPAAILLLASPTVCTVGTICLKRFGSRCSSALVNRNAAIVGALLLCGAALLTEDTDLRTWSTAAWATITYLSLIGTFVAFGLYHWLLRHAQASRLSLVAYVTPPIALGLGWLIRGEPIYAHTLAGTALIALGVAMVVRR